MGLAVRDVRAEGLSASQRCHRLRRVLRLFQLLPRRLGAAAGVALLQARRRAARPRGRTAARRRLRSARRATAVPRRRRCCSRSLGSALGVARRRRLRRAAHVRPRARGGSTRSARRRSRCTSSCDVARRRRRRRHRSPRSSASGGRCGASAACPSGACWPGTARRRTPRTSAATAERRDAGDRAPALVAGRGGRLLDRAARRGDGSIRPARSSAPASRCWCAALCLFAVALRRAPPRASSAATAGGRCRGSASATPPTGPGAACCRWRSSPSATFMLISVDAFRRDGAAATADPQSGTGGYRLVVETLLPIVHDPNTADGPRGAEPVRPRRLRHARAVPRCCPGDDASCLNLYEPRNPRILAPRDAFLRRRALRLPGVAGVDRRRAREPVAAAVARAAGWRRSGHRRRQLDDLRAASRARRGHRHRARRPADPAAARRPRCATASSRASC